MAEDVGWRGMHVYVPVDAAMYERTKAHVRAVAAVLAQQHASLVVDRMAKAARRGKVFIDWSQNDFGKSTVVAYSLRGTIPPLVSAPVTWEEVEAVVAAGDARPLLLGPDDVLARIDERGDLFAPVLTQHVRLLV
nr:hypothetical protein [Pseudonocardia nigra]